MQRTYCDFTALRLADINGDGRDDLVFVDLADSTVQAWSNDGAIG